MNLNIMELIVVLGILPKEGSFVTLKILNGLRLALSFTEKEIKEWGITADQVANITKWQVNGEAEIPIGEKATDLIVDALKELDKKKKLPDNAISVYENKSAPTKEGFDKFLDEIRQSYLNNPDVSLLSFDPGFHPGEYLTGEYVAASLWKKSAVTYEQTELGLVTQGGHIYILTANVDQQKSKKYI